MKGLLILLGLLELIQVSFCWWDLGHMLVAKVAEITLMKEDPDAFNLANRIVSILNIFSHGKVNNFVESACWSDDLKTFSLHAMDDWHYIDVPVNLTSVIEYLNVTSTPDNALGVLLTANKSLNSWKSYETLNLNQEFEKSLLFRYLIHVLGDIHQPLHASSLINEQFPNGDLGGNSFKIKFRDNIENLHKLFDSGADILVKEINRPLTEESNQYISTLAVQYIKEFSRESIPEFNQKLFKDWILESHDISKNFIYSEIKFGEVPTEDYLMKAYDITRKRITLGGYRLAEIVKSINHSYNHILKDENKDNKDNQNNYHKKTLGFLSE